MFDSRWLLEIEIDTASDFGDPELALALRRARSVDSGQSAPSRRDQQRRGACD
jgi:hypothetical protein